MKLVRVDEPLRNHDFLSLSLSLPVAPFARRAFLAFNLNFPEITRSKSTEGVEESVVQLDRHISHFGEDK